jgi:alpha-galactosidase
MFEISTQHLHLKLQTENGQLQLLTLSTPDNNSWLHPGHPAELFTCHIDGQRLSVVNLKFENAREENNGIRRMVYSFIGEPVSVEYFLQYYEGSGILEGWPVIRNISSYPIQVERIDSIAFHLTFEQAELFSFTGDWGSEFEPHHPFLTEKTILESGTGRSSKGNHPWFAMTRQDGQVLSGSVGWSGNWIFRFEPDQNGGFQLSGGLNDWGFGKTLNSGETIQGAPIILALGNSLDHVSQQLARVGRKYWYPANELSSALPLEWNHWWSYENVEINETVFLQNVE